MTFVQFQKEAEEAQRHAAAMSHAGGAGQHHGAPGCLARVLRCLRFKSCIDSSDQVTPAAHDTPSNAVRKRTIIVWLVHRFLENRINSFKLLLGYFLRRTTNVNLLRILRKFEISHFVSCFQFVGLLEVDAVNTNRHDCCICC